MRFLVRLVINAVALWFTTFIVSGVTVEPFAGGGGDTSNTIRTVLTYLVVAFVFGLVNGIIGTVVKIVAFPLYIVTLGLISLVINGLLLLVVSWISEAIGFGLHVASFGSGILGALVLAILAWLIGLVLRPLFGSVTRRA